MKEQNTVDPIREEREYYRSLFWAAFAKYRELGHIPSHSCLANGNHIEGHKADMKKGSDWRADFVNCGKRILHGGEDGRDQTEWIIFSKHMVYLEEVAYEENGKRHTRWAVMSPGKSIRKTISIIHGIYGEDKAIGMYQFGTVKAIIAEKVGAALEKQRIWPIDVYFKGEAA